MYVPYLYTRWKLKGFNCACNRNCMISRLRKPSAQIWRLARSFRILRIRSTISRLRKFLDCAEYLSSKSVSQCIRLYAESHLNIWLALLHKLTQVNNEWGSCSNCAVAGSCLEYMLASELEFQEAENNLLIVYTEGLLWQCASMGVSNYSVHSNRTLTTTKPTEHSCNTSGTTSWGHH